MFFWCIYKLYLTKLGKSFHKSQIKKCHDKGFYIKRKLDSGSITVGAVKIHIIPYLKDNYAYIM